MKPHLAAATLSFHTRWHPPGAGSRFRQGTPRGQAVNRGRMAANFHAAPCVCRECPMGVGAQWTRHTQNRGVVEASRALATAGRRATPARARPRRLPAGGQGVRRPPRSQACGVGLTPQTPLEGVPHVGTTLTGKPRPPFSRIETQGAAEAPLPVALSLVFQGQERVGTPVRGALRGRWRPSPFTPRAATARSSPSVAWRGS